ERRARARREEAKLPPPEPVLVAARQSTPNLRTERQEKCPGAQFCFDRPIPEAQDGRLSQNAIGKTLKAFASTRRGESLTDHRFPFPGGTVACILVQHFSRYPEMGFWTASPSGRANIGTIRALKNRAYDCDLYLG